MIAAYPGNAPKCFMCGLGWAVLFVPSSRELTAHADEPPYWKCGVCSNVWPLNYDESLVHRQLMERTRAMHDEKINHQRKKTESRRAAKTAAAVKSYERKDARR